MSFKEITVHIFHYKKLYKVQLCSQLIPKKFADVEITNASFDENPDRICAELSRMPVTTMGGTI
jgi:hypothetical protein